MATEQLKPASLEQSTTYPPPAGPFAYPPPPPGYPPFFAYPPPTDGQQPDGNGAPAPPYPMIYAPPGMVYAFPPQAPPSASSTPATTSRPKRKQVKMACTNCAAACKRCDESRPCERCQKYGIADSCVDGQRKERKKGVKRGPYKRKNKQTVETAYDYVLPEGEWTQGAAPPNGTTTAAIHGNAIAPFPAPPDGYYPVYYPPPGAYPIPDGQSGSDGANANAHPPPLMPFYVSGFPPYPYPFPPPPGAVFQLPPSTSHPPPLPSVNPLTVEAGSTPQTEKKGEEAPTSTESSGASPSNVSDAGGIKKPKGNDNMTKTEKGTNKAEDKEEASGVSTET